MSIEGALRIRLDCDNAAVNQVHIDSTRPLHITKVLIGKSPEECLATVRLLFYVCGNAQSYATLTALRQAMGVATEATAERARQLLVLLETVREHTMRILMDWPRFLDRPPENKRLAELLQLERSASALLFEGGEAFNLKVSPSICLAEFRVLVDRLESLLDETVFGGTQQAWMVLKNEAQLLNWSEKNESLPAELLKDLYRRDWQGIGQNDIDTLPELEDEPLRRLLVEDNFSRAPRWLGCCYETSPLARQRMHPLLVDLRQHYRNGMVSRVAARLQELAGMPTRLRQLLAQLESEPLHGNSAVEAMPWGVAQVQAARGLLIHGVCLRQGLVEDYRIVAPTEWNFHPQGVVAESLKQLQSKNHDITMRQAELLINAIDPCVQYRIGIKTNCQE